LVLSELSGVELSAIVENDGARNVKASDDVSPYEPSYFGCSYGGNDLSLYPLDEVVDYYKEILTLSHCFRERSKDVHTPSSERQATENWRHWGGGDSLDGHELLAFASSHQSHVVFP